MHEWWEKPDFSTWALSLWYHQCNPHRHFRADPFHLEQQQMYQQLVIPQSSSELQRPSLYMSSFCTLPLNTWRNIYWEAGKISWKKTCIWWSGPWQILCILVSPDISLGLFSNMCIPTQTSWKKFSCSLRTNIQKFRPVQLNVLAKI